MKVHCFPLYVGLELRVFKLQGSELTVEHHPVKMTLISEDSKNTLAQSLEGSREVSPEEFQVLIEAHASKESVEHVMEQLLENSKS